MLRPRLAGIGRDQLVELLALGLQGAALAAVLADPRFRQRVREELASPSTFRLFNGEWQKVHVVQAAQERHRALEQKSIAELARRGQSMATAESLTAGLLAATVAGVPGASAVLRGGLIVYATELKEALAGVPAQTLAADGPVAASTAQALAQGAAGRCGATWGVGLTGVAGPEPQDGKAVGTVFAGFVGPGPAGDRVAWVRPLRLDGQRWDIRSGAVRAALVELLEAVRRQ